MAIFKFLKLKNILFHTICFLKYNFLLSPHLHLWLMTWKCNKNMTSKSSRTHEFWPIYPYTATKYMKSILEKILNIHKMIIVFNIYSYDEQLLNCIIKSHKLKFSFINLNVSRNFTSICWLIWISILNIDLIKSDGV